MSNETFWNINLNMVIASGVLMIAFLLYYIAFGKEGKKSKGKARFAK